MAADPGTKPGPREVWNPVELGLEKTALQASLSDRSQSALQKYQSVFVGSTRWVRLVQYELVTCLLAPLPGALGFFSRKLVYPSFLGQVGEGVAFGRSMTIRHPRRITIGSRVLIDDYAVLDAKGENNEGITISDDAIIGRSTVLSCKNGNIHVGRNANIAMSCFIQSSGEVFIGDNVLISAYCYLIGGGDHKTDRTDIPIIAQGQVVRGIRIEHNCLLGAGVKIQDGVSVGRDSIIGSGSVVTSDIPEFSVAAGVPAKVLKKRA
jgi:acetyltransferase-like isoleucine patch superfamily enzyme